MSDQVDKMLERTTREMEAAKKTLQELANEVTALVEILQPGTGKTDGRLEICSDDGGQ